MFAKRFALFKGVVATVALVLAVVRFAYPQTRDGMDATFLGLLGMAVLILILPWERLRTLKAGGVELSIEGPQVRGAIAGLGLDRVDDEQLRARLRAMAPLIEQISGARVLWIDDRPRVVLGERRLLRSLGVEVVPVSSSDDALRALRADSDFDLIISDVQRGGVSYKWVENGTDIHEGANFVVLLYRSPDKRIQPVPPVLFFSAYPWKSLLEYTERATAVSPRVEVCRPRRPKETPRVSDLITRAVVALAEARSNPISVGTTKEGTKIAGPLSRLTVEEWAKPGGAQEEESEDEEESRGVDQYG